MTECLAATDAFELATSCRRKRRPSPPPASPHTCEPADLAATFSPSPLPPSPPLPSGHNTRLHKTNARMEAKAAAKAEAPAVASAKAAAETATFFPLSECALGEPWRAL